MRFLYHVVSIRFFGGPIAVSQSKKVVKRAMEFDCPGEALKCLIKSHMKKTPFLPSAFLPRNSVPGA